MKPLVWGQKCFKQVAVDTAAQKGFHGHLLILQSPEGCELSLGEDGIARRSFGIVQFKPGLLLAACSSCRAWKHLRAGAPPASADNSATWRISLCLRVTPAGIVSSRFY